MKEKIQWSTIEELARHFHLQSPKRISGSIGGEIFGKGTGSSLEFQDYRAYSPGDDLRHIDWRAYGRMDALFVKLYREEIAPKVQIILDTSASMAISEDKALRALELALFFHRMAQKNFQSEMILAGDKVEVLRDWNEACQRIPSFESRNFEWERIHLSSQSVRILISDFLWPLDIQKVLRKLLGEASFGACLQILSQEEMDPPWEGFFELEDSEWGTKEVLQVDDFAKEEYKKRLRQLQEMVNQEAYVHHHLFIPLESQESLKELAFQKLVTKGILGIQ
ncbi:MAG: DUF58 domain-containing protein [Planctomycetota bacterium]|nr:MAG: DUF58 domain-containing protein [Planctomycetota bacterium]